VYSATALVRPRVTASWSSPTKVTPFGWLPPGRCGNGFTSMVWTRWSLVVSMTETVSDEVSVTNRVLPCSTAPVGWRPTGMVPVVLPAARSTTETAPVAGPPVTGSATIGVPAESLTTSPGCAVRPPWSVTYALAATSTTACGALPTGISRTIFSLARSSTPSALSRFIATYSVAPSGETARPPGYGLPLVCGSAISLAPPMVPSARTAARTIRPSADDANSS
jgi:hypothetical protein